MFGRAVLSRRPRRGFGLALVLVLAPVPVLIPSTEPRADAAEATTIAVPEAIDSSGTTDVTDALNAFFRTVPSGSTVAFPEEGRYRVEGIVQIESASDITIDGNGSTLFAETDGRDQVPPRRAYNNHWPRRREHLTLNRVTNVHIHDLVVRGANPDGGATTRAYVPSLEGQAGIAIIGGTGILLEQVTITDTYGDLIYIAGGATDVTVRESRLRRSGRQGVAVVNGRDVLIEDSELAGIGRSVLDLEPLGKGLARDIRFVNNEVGDYLNFLLAAVGGGTGVDNIDVVDNAISADRGLSVVAGVERNPRSGLRLVGNRGTTKAVALEGFGTGALIQLTNLDGVEVRDNHQPVAGGVAITLDRVCNAKVADNSFSGADPVEETLAECGAGAPTQDPDPDPGATSSTSIASGDDRATGQLPESADPGSGSSPGWAGAALAGVLGLAAGGAGGWWARARRARPSDDTGAA